MNQDLNPGEGPSPDSFFPSFRRGSRTINQSAAKKGLFYENENFIHNKFDESVVPPLREGPWTSHPARPRRRMACAFADGSGG